MSFAELLARTWTDERLFSVLLEMTFRCNLDCVYCYNDLGKRGRALSREQYARLLEDLAGMQVLNLTFSGGEPLAHPDLFPLGRRARELGFVVRVKTNGHAVGPDMAARLRDEIDPFVLEVSLHGARAETHDRQTRVPGSFDRLLANLRAMREAGLRVRINSTLTRWNEDEVEGMLELADGLGMPLHIDPVVTPRDDGDRSPLELTASPAGRARLFRLQRERAAARRDGEATVREDAPPDLVVALQGDDLAGAGATTKHCGAGSATVAIDPFGDVFPCVQWRVSVGNLHENGIREIWESSPALADLRRANVDVKRRLAVYGEDAGLLGHCPGLAAQASGGDPAWVSPEQERNLLLRQHVERPGIPLPAHPGVDLPR